MSYRSIHDNSDASDYEREVYDDGFSNGNTNNVSSNSDQDVDELVKKVANLEIGEEYRRFGYFRCKSCKRQWQSAHVYCEYVGKVEDEDEFEVSLLMTHLFH